MQLQIISYDSPSLNIIPKLNGITLDLNIQPAPSLNVFIDELRVHQETPQQFQNFTPSQSAIPQINNNNPNFQYVTLVGAKGDEGQRGQNAGSFSEPSFIRNDDGKIIRINYSSGQFKELAYYVSGKLNTITTTHSPNDISVKTFNYTDGLLTSITET